MARVWEFSVSIPVLPVLVFAMGAGIGILVSFSVFHFRKNRQRKKLLRLRGGNGQNIVITPSQSLSVGGMGSDMVLPDLRKPLALATIEWSGRSKKALLLTPNLGSVRIGRNRITANSTYRLGEEITFRFEHRSYRLKLLAET